MSFRFSIFSIHSPVIPNLDPLPVTPPSALRIKKSNTANVVVLVISVYDRQWTKEPLNNYFQSVKTVIWLMIWVTSSLSFHPFFSSFQFYSVHSLRNKRNGSSTKSHFENMKNDPKGKRFSRHSMIQISHRMSHNLWSINNLYLGSV